MSLRLTPISSTDDPAMISKDGIAGRLHVDLDDALVEPPFTELFAHPIAGTARLLPDDGRILAGSGRPRGRQQQVEQAILGGGARLLAHLFALFRAHHVDGQLHEIADHRFDVPTDVAHLGELRGLDLDEGRVRQPRQSPRNLGLPDTGRSDHQDVLGRDLVGDLRRQALATEAVAQGDRHGPLRLGLSDDVLVELGDDLAGRQRAHCGRRAFGKGNGHTS